MSMKSAALLMVTAAMGLAACTGHQTPARAWVVRTYPGDGMVATLTQPPDWTVQLPPANAHYAAVFAYLGSFPLRPFCHKTANRVFCSPGEAGAFPPGGVVVILGTGGYGPGPQSRERLLSYGRPTKLGGRRASVQQLDGRSCLGSGADHQLLYRVDDGRAQGLFSISFCWRGDGASLGRDVRRVASSLRLRPDPTATSPHPS